MSMSELPDASESPAATAATAATAAAAPEVDRSDDLVGLPDFMVVAIEQRRAAEAAADLAAACRAKSSVNEARRARARSSNASSVVFTLRLGHEDFAALHSQAATRSVAPSVLARSLIRNGLRQPAPSIVPGFGVDVGALAQRVRSAASVER